jgi:hypothetical protein
MLRTLKSLRGVVVFSAVSVFAVPATCAADPARPVTQPKNSFQLVGRWVGMSQGEKGSFVFSADGRADIIIGGDSLRSKFGNQGTIRYVADQTKTPKEIDLIVVSNSGTELARIRMIFEVIEPRTIRVRSSFDDVRPSGFDSTPSEDTIVLYRQD